MRNFSFAHFFIHSWHRPVVPGCAMAHPDFGRSVNPISTRGDRLCPLNYYWHTLIFRPSDGPVAGLGLNRMCGALFSAQMAHKLVQISSAKQTKVAI